MEITFPNAPEHGGKTPAMVSTEVRRLHDVVDLSYRKIALLEPFIGIPQSSINAIGQGRTPRKWYKQLGIIAPVEIIPCLTCGIVHLGRCPSSNPSPYERTPGGWVNAEDPKKAARLILKRAKYSVDELVHELILESHKDEC